MRIPDGTLEALKWFALIAMVMDHINKDLLSESAPTLSHIGRMAMPLFGFILAYNMARPTTPHGHQGAMRRMAMSGIAATPFFIALQSNAGSQMGKGWEWWPLNIMFLMLASTGIVQLLQNNAQSSTMNAHWINQGAAFGVFLAAGMLVEFWWPGIALVLASWWYCRTTSRSALAAVLACLIFLQWLSQSWWVFAPLPLVWASQFFSIGIPRMRNIFYVFYPAHLAAILMAKKFIREENIFSHPITHWIT